MVRGTLRIRRAEAQDLPALMNIERASFAPEIQESEETFADRLNAFPGGALILETGSEGNRNDREDCRRAGNCSNGGNGGNGGCRRSGEPVGYLTAEIWDKAPPPSAEGYRLGHRASERHNPEGRVLYISSFAVLPEARGGTGRAFFSEALDLLCAENPKIDRVVFIVHEQWRAARHIYEGCGFQYTGVLPSFFKDGDAGSDALIMEKKR